MLRLSLELDAFEAVHIMIFQPTVLVHGWCRCKDSSTVIVVMTGGQT